MKIKKIAIDLDGTVFNTVEKICQMYNEDFCLYEGFVPIDWRDVKTWDFKELDLETPENIDKYFCQPRFFMDLKLFSGAKWIISKLSRKYSIVFISSGYKPNLIMKKLWVKENFPYAEFIGVDLSQYNDKSLVDMSDCIFIDDVSNNLKTSNAAYKICYGKKYPWNEDWNGKRCEEWVEIYQEVRKLENKIQNN